MFNWTIFTKTHYSHAETDNFDQDSFSPAETRVLNHARFQHCETIALVVTLTHYRKAFRAQLSRALV
jgi:hypothetical protein